MAKYLVDLNDVNVTHRHIVGGKNASTGEMLQHLVSQGIKVPSGFATTIAAYQEFLAQNQLDQRIHQALKKTNINDVKALNKTSAQIRRWISETPFSQDFEAEIAQALKKNKSASFAVRSSASAEDLAEASFAGQQETFLNVKGLKWILQAIKQVYASLYTSRAIHYRQRHHLKSSDVGISVGIQTMIRSDKGASGVIFTLDTESGFDKVILIDASYGLGEAVVQGKVNPDEFYVFKPSLEQNKFSILQRKLGDKLQKMIYGSKVQLHATIKTVKTSNAEREKFCIDDHDVETLARYALQIEKHYERPMDIEWAKDGITGEIFIVQARPETVKSRGSSQVIERYHLAKPGQVLAEGVSIGHRIGAGTARVILDNKKIRDVKPGDVIVTDMTDPDWEPVMKIASAIVTNRGGRTCHAAIVARELGIPAVVGCNDATKKIKNGAAVTVSCAEGEKGLIYADRIPFEVSQIEVKEMPQLPLNMCVNAGNPEIAFATQFLPNEGVGLARLEFIISNIGIHPNAALNYKKLPKKLQQEIKQRTSAYANPVAYYRDKLTEGIAKISAAFYPKQVIFRFSDFKSNEYANLLGGNLFEQQEENPMIGFRGASRYYDERFRACFELECQAFKRVRDEMGLTNAQIMIPFVRTVGELQKVIRLAEQYGLTRHQNDLKIYMMCEVPSNVILAKEFLRHVDGYSIGSNDLTQLVLGLDRDSSIVAKLFDERNEAIKLFLHEVIQECNRQNKYIGICGQGPSDHPDFAEWLMQEGIQSMSLNADTIIETWMLLASKIKSRTDAEAASVK